VPPVGFSGSALVARRELGAALACVDQLVPDVFHYHSRWRIEPLARAIVSLPVFAMTRSCGADPSSAWSDRSSASSLDAHQPRHVPSPILNVMGMALTRCQQTDGLCENAIDELDKAIRLMD
jgi:hypothetical protein